MKNAFKYLIVAAFCTVALIEHSNNTATPVEVKNLSCTYNKFGAKDKTKFSISASQNSAVMNGREHHLKYDMGGNYFFDDLDLIYDSAKNTMIEHPNSFGQYVNLKCEEVK